MTHEPRKPLVMNWTLRLATMADIPALRWDENISTRRMMR